MAFFLPEIRNQALISVPCLLVFIAFIFKEKDNHGQKLSQSTNKLLSLPIVLGLLIISDDVALITSLFSYINHFFIYKNYPAFMKLRFIYTCFLAALCLVIFQSNRTGRATNGDEGVTGAPGDATLGGQPKTCGSCHSGGNFGPVTVGITLLKTNGDTATGYVPGERYTARVRITPGAGTPIGYGFQMITIRDATKTEVKALSDMGSNNRYKLRTISNGRTYAEQETMSQLNTFDVEWTGPAKGTGTVTLHAAGNAVNNIGGSAGDNANIANLKVTELQQSNTPSIASPVSRFVVSPNPVGVQQAWVQFDLIEAGESLLRVLSLDGRVLWQSNATLPVGEHTVAMPAEQWSAGIYIVQMQQANKVASTKWVRL